MKSLKKLNMSLYLCRRSLFLSGRLQYPEWRCIHLSSTKRARGRTTSSYNHVLINCKCICFSVSGSIYLSIFCILLAIYKAFKSMNGAKPWHTHTHNKLGGGEYWEKTCMCEAKNVHQLPFMNNRTCRTWFNVHRD